MSCVSQSLCCGEVSVCSCSVMTSCATASPMPSSGLGLTDKILTEVGTRVPTRTGDGYRGSLAETVEPIRQGGIECGGLLQVDDVACARQHDQPGSGQGFGQSTRRVERCAIALSDDH